MKKTSRAVNNRSITISEKEISKYSTELINLKTAQKINQVVNKIIHQDIFKAIKFLPENFVDLLFLDPPYNMSKTFNSNKFSKRSIDEYTEWLDKLFSEIVTTLKHNASIYVCGDWLSSTSIHYTS